MRVLISAEGEHDPPGLHLMQVDNLQFLIDLSKVRGSLVDPSISRIEWGPTVLNGEVRDGGHIVRRDGTKQTFWDVKALAPYLAAFRAKQDEIAAQNVGAQS